MSRMFITQECTGCGCWYETSGACTTLGCDGSLETITAHLCGGGCYETCTSRWEMASHELNEHGLLLESVKTLLPYL